jgi:hypothetical protein
LEQVPGESLEYGIVTVLRVMLARCTTNWFWKHNKNKSGAGIDAVLISDCCGRGGVAVWRITHGAAKLLLCDVVCLLTTGYYSISIESSCMDRAWKLYVRHWLGHALNVKVHQALFPFPANFKQFSARIYEVP